MRCSVGAWVSRPRIGSQAQVRVAGVEGIAAVAAASLFRLLCTQEHSAGLGADEDKFPAGGTEDKIRFDHAWIYGLPEVDGPEFRAVTGGSKEGLGFEHIHEYGPWQGLAPEPWEGNKLFLGRLGGIHFGEDECATIHSEHDADGRGFGECCEGAADDRIGLEQLGLGSGRLGAGQQGAYAVVITGCFVESDPEKCGGCRDGVFQFGLAAAHGLDFEDLPPCALEVGGGLPDGPNGGGGSCGAQRNRLVARLGDGHSRILSCE